MIKGTIRFMLMTACFALPVSAEEPVILEPITVEARETISAERNIKTLDLDAETEPVVSTVADALEIVPGLDVQRRSILTPKSSQVRIRGMEEKRSLILLDGRPLNGTGVMGGQFVDWSVLSLLGWETVEIGKGAFSAKHGNTLGGTIDLIPAFPAAEPTATLHAGYRRYDTFSAGATGSGWLGPLGGVLNGGYADTDGHLRNSAAERTDLGGRFYYIWGDDGEIMAAVRYTNGDFEMPVENRSDSAGYDDDFPHASGSYLIGPGIAFPSGDRHGDGSFYTKDRYELDLSLTKNIRDITGKLKLYFNNEDREDTIYSYGTGEVVLEREATPDRSWGWLVRFEKFVSDHRIGFGADGNYQGYGGTENTFIQEGYFPRPPTDGDDEWDGTRWHGAYIDDLWRIHPALDLYVGLRYEDYYGDREVDTVLGYKNGKPAGFSTTTAEFDEKAFLPKLGLVYRPLDGISLHGRFARATRFPDNPAFYWYYGGYTPEVDPDSDIVRGDLTYEDALQYELGAAYTGLPGWSASFSWYYYEVDDYLRWIFGYPPSRVVYNLDEVTFQGIEMEVEGIIWKNIAAFANFTWQETEKKGDVLDASNALTDELSELPEMKFNLGIKYRRPDGALAKFTLRWVDERRVPYIGDSGAPFAGSGAPDGAPVGKAVTLVTLDDFMTADVLVKYPLWKGTTGTAFLTAGVENLFDEDYREEYDFPAPGRMFHIGAEAHF